MRHREDLARKNDQHDILVIVHTWQFTADDFVDTPSDTVSPDGAFVYFLTYHDRDARMGALRVAAMFERHQARSHSMAMRVHVAQATMTMKSVFERQHMSLV